MENNLVNGVLVGEFWSMNKEKGKSFDDVGNCVLLCIQTCLFFLSDSIFLQF